ncbi:retrovirus-related Pol polyprotein from type-1 retrotransposable element R1 [Trichonephila clavipes]|nr:retrovirus-related Pol polyprotein from type-1 retrotransposable element R1 [Trichonephila clavipes]
MDSNSKSELWFSPYSDARGNKLSEFISANNLFIINEDCGPTFRATQGTSYIDITVVGSDLLEDNSSWCLSENESLSDHVMIEFEFCLSTVLRDTSSAPFVIFNTKKANWCRFRKFCLSRMTHIFDTLNSCTNSSCLNTVIEELSFVIHQACLYSIPIKKTSKHNVPWWSIEIGCARKRLNASRRRFQRCKNPTVRELYKNSYLEYRKDYNQMLINAKSESWKKFLLTIDAQNVWKKKSFPSDSEEKDNIFQKDYRHAARTAYPSFFDPSFSYDEVNTMVSMLKLNKSPGPDSISNEIIKQFHLAFPSFLHKLFNVCLGLGIFPRIWKLAQVILIPKVNEFRVPHLDNLRCISLLPALAFADDILVCSQGRDISETFLHAQEALNFASDWSKSFKLEFNPDKTRFMAIEKRNVCYDAFQLYLDGTPLTMVKQMKYLGVLLDTKFSWKQHLSYISEKCDKLQRGLNRIARNTFGINFNVHSLIYKQEIEPFILYGSRVWGEALKRKMNSKYLRRIQRRILLRVIWGYRTISYDSVYAISGFPPIDSTILHDIAFIENLSASSISNYDCILSPFFIPHPSERNAINTVQFSDKSTEVFRLFAILMAVKLMEKLVSHLLCSGVVLNPRTFNLEFVMNAQFL